MVQAKRHHFVPRMILQNFCNPTGRLWACRVGSKTPFNPSPENVFAEQHLYREELPDGRTTIRLEETFSEFERIVAPLIVRVIDHARAGRSYPFTPTERGNIDLFAYMQMRRIPSIHTRGFMAGEAERLVAQAIAELVEEHPDKLDEIAALADEPTRARMVKNAQIRSMFNISDKVLNAMALRGLTVARIHTPDRRKFIIGSTPVVRWGLGGLQNPNHEIWMPVASDVAIGLRRTRLETRLLNGITTESIRNLNVSIAKQSDMIAGADRQLILSLSNAH